MTPFRYLLCVQLLMAVVLYNGVVAPKGDGSSGGKPSQPGKPASSQTIPDEEEFDEPSDTPTFSETSPTALGESKGEPTTPLKDSKGTPVKNSKVAKYFFVYDSAALEDSKGRAPTRPARSRFYDNERGLVYLAPTAVASGDVGTIPKDSKGAPTPEPEDLSLKELRRMLKESKGLPLDKQKQKAAKPDSKGSTKHGSFKLGRTDEPLFALKKAMSDMQSEAKFTEVILFAKYAAKPQTPSDSKGDMSRMARCVYTNCVDPDSPEQLVAQKKFPYNLPKLPVKGTKVVAPPPLMAITKAGFVKLKLLEKDDVGKQVNDWLIVGLLGQGEFGAVFLVWNGKHFAALKRVNRARSTDKGSALLQNWRREMFETEMTIQYELGEQGIAPSVHAVIMDDQNCMYAIMDVMNGGNLEEYVAGKVAQGSWSENELQDIVFKLAIKLHAMHEMGYAHRDFKLSNTMLNHNTMEPFISDFGETTTISNLVQSSCNRGEFGVQPPERGIELFKLLPKDQRRMDAYSFGLAMAHMYAGKRVMAELVIIDTTVGKFNYNRPLDVSKEPWFVALQNVNAKLAIQSLLNQNFMLRWTMKQLLLSDYLKDAVKRGLANESQRRQLWASKNKDKDSSDHRGKK